MQSVYSTIPVDWGHRRLIFGGKSYPLSRDAVGVYYKSQSTVSQDTNFVGNLTPLKRCSRCILQIPVDWATGHSFRWKSLPFLQRCSRVYSTISVDCVTGHSFRRKSYHSAEMQSVYSTISVDCVTGHSFRRKSYPSAEMQSVYSTISVDCVTGHSFRRKSLPLCRDTRGVFYNPSYLSQVYNKRMCNEHVRSTRLSAFLRIKK